MLPSPTQPTPKVPSGSLLALDIGNTRLKWAWYEQAQPGAHAQAQGTVFLERIPELVDAWKNLPEPALILGCLVASPGVKAQIAECTEHWACVPQWVVPTPCEGGITNTYTHPARLGADRWVAMIGARQRWKDQACTAPVVVAMVGTAVTVDALDAQGRFLGGFILPGHGIMLKALTTGTAGLHVPTGQVMPFPTNTSDALTSGGTYAITGAIERMVQQLTSRSGQQALCWLSGGAAWKVAPHLDKNLAFDLIENLVFEGLLALAPERMCKDAAITGLIPID
jgi:type III pantothenate kinase